MKLSRRELLAVGLASGILPPFKAFAIKHDERILISAASDQKGHHWAICLEHNGEIISQLKLPARAHEIIKHPTKSQIAIIGRRPGQYLLISSIQSASVIRQLEPELGYHFYGHALFTSDGRYLITTENHIESGQGFIFVRDAENNYKVSKYFPSYGIGPHEVKLSRDNDTLVIANGGILTHPDKGRQKLNLNTMTPSLAYVSLNTGNLLEKVALEKDYHQLSIRHLDINDKDEVLVAMQYQGDPTDQVPLIASHQRGEALKPLLAPDSVNYSMKHYCGSVCFDPSGKVAAVSSPKGNLITFWDYEKHKFLSSIRCKDACGIASYRNNEFIISNGLGGLFSFDIELNKLEKISSLRNPDSNFDNHLTIS